MSLDPRIEAVREKYGLDKDDFWQIPQNKQWVCKHAALEIVATKAKVEWSAPQIIQADTANGIAVLSVTGKMGDRVEWSTGEASPKNNKNAYPWAMAEKRAKDRVVLKLAGIHGLVYSEDEMPDDVRRSNEQAGKEPSTKQQDKPISSAENKRQLAEIDKDLLDCHSEGDVKRCADIWQSIATRDGWSRDYKVIAKEKFDAKRVELNKLAGQGGMSDAEASRHPLNA